MAELSKIMAEVRRGCAELIDEARVEGLIRKFYEEGTDFFVKIGLDPTAPDLHLGHSVVLNKMAFLQKHGAIIQFLIGDFTGQIGDPTGKNATRKTLSHEEVLANAKSYEEQVFKILDPARTRIFFNSTWLGELGSAGLVGLAGQFSVARMLERDDFTKRFREQGHISISEFLYPLLQGYDSVALKSDIEMGGTDQKFNLLMGRTLQRAYGLGKEQAVIMLPLLEGLDGVAKMSKSLGNYVGVSESASEIYAKLLSISDTLMWRYFELLSQKSLDEISALKAGVKAGQIHPKAAKEELALELASRFAGAPAAAAARSEFDRIHSQKLGPSEFEEFELALSSLGGEKGGGESRETVSGGGEAAGLWLPLALVRCGLAPSTSEARRLIRAGAVSLNAQKITDEQLRLGLGEQTLQVGKRKFAKLRLTP